MALKPTARSNDRVNQEDLVGTYPCRLVQIIDLGLQKQREFKGTVKKPANEVMFTYELTDEFMKDEEGNDIEDKPRWVSESLPWYGTFADKATSTKRYLVFDPTNAKEDDLAHCISMPALVTLIVNKKEDKTYNNVANLTAMRAKDADKCPELKNKAVVFDLSEPDIDVFNKLPEWVRKKIQSNLEYAGSPLEKLVGKPTQSAPKEQEKKEDDAPSEDDVPY